MFFFLFKISKTSEPYNWKRIPASTTPTKEGEVTISSLASKTEKSTAVAEFLVRGKLAFSNRDIAKGLTFERVRGLLAKDVWLRHLDLTSRQKHSGIPGFRWDLEVSESIPTDTNINSSAITGTSPEIKNRKQKQVKTAPVLAALKGVLTPNADKYFASVPLDARFAALTAKSIKAGHIYSRDVLAYIDVARKRELAGTALKEFYQQSIRERNQENTTKSNVIPHPGPYTVPIRIILAVPAPKLSSRGAGTGSVAGTVRNVVDTEFVLPRLELLPGLTGFVVGSKSLYAQQGRYIVRHPLGSPTAETVENKLKLYVVENGPNEPTPLFLGNDDTYLGALTGEPVQSARAIDLHGEVNFDKYMSLIPNLNTADDGSGQYLTSDTDSSNSCRVYVGRKTLPISLANQAVYNILTARYGTQFKKVQVKSSATAESQLSSNYMIPGVLEPVLVKKWYVNTQSVHKAVARYCSELQTHFSTPMADIPLVEANLDDSNVNLVSSTRLGLQVAEASRRAAFTVENQIDDGMVAFDWVCNVYNEAYAIESGASTDGVPMPIVVDNDDGACVTEKLYLLCALLLHTAVLNHTPFVILDQALSSPDAVNLKSLTERKDLTLDSVRSTLSETFVDKPALALTKVSVRENMDVLRLFYSLIQEMRGVTGVTVPLRAPVGHLTAAIAATAVQPYEKFTLHELDRLMRQYNSLFVRGSHNFDLCMSKRLVEETILTVATYWMPFAHIDQAYEFNPTHSNSKSSGLAGANYERALAHTAVTMRIFRTLYTLAYPLWPDLTRALAHTFELRFKTPIVSVFQKLIAPEDSVLAELTITEHDIGVFDNYIRILDAIERVVDINPRKAPRNSKTNDFNESCDIIGAAARVPRHYYRGYLCVQDDKTLIDALGISGSRETANLGPVLALKRVADVGLLTVSTSPTIFNTGNLGTVQIAAGLQLRSFDNRLWTSAVSAGAEMKG